MNTQPTENTFPTARDAVREWIEAGLIQEAKLLEYTLNAHEAETEEGWDQPDLASIHYAKLAILQMRELGTPTISGSGNGEIELAFGPESHVQACLTPHGDGTASRYLFIEKPSNETDHIEFEREPFGVAVRTLKENTLKAIQG